MQFSFTPSVSDAEIRQRLERLLVPGSLLNPGLERRIGRLSRAFRSYAASYPLPLWAPGLVITNEMRGMTQALFPLAETRAVFEQVLRHGCRFAPLLSGSYLHSSPCWVDLLQKLWPQLGSADPTPALRRLAEDGAARTAFLFALMLPKHFGGGFDRYQQQALWLAGWLEEKAGSFQGGMRLLDAACGSGEGTYQTARLLVDAGLGLESAVHGSTLEPVELFAAAHMFFPHAAEREREYRGRVASLVSESGAPTLEFYLDRVDAMPRREPYHVVLCNGLLGGPLLHEPQELSAAFAGLAARLAPGGLLLAADRFHAGWRLRVPTGTLLAQMQVHGLTPIAVPEGIAGVKTERQVEVEVEVEVE